MCKALRFPLSFLALGLSTVLIADALAGFEILSVVALVTSSTKLPALSPVTGTQTANTELELGVAAYREATYEEAVAHFKQCIALDPNRVAPHLYLAVAYARQYIPGLDTVDNNQMARQAIEEFAKVLELKPRHEEEISTLRGIASLYLNMKQLEKSRNYHKKLLRLTLRTPKVTSP